MRLLHGLLAKFLPAKVVAISELREGYAATVRGVVVPRDLMDSPLSGDRCVYYRYSTEQWRHSRIAGVGGDGFWELVERDEAILEFYLDDGDGRVIVAPHNARVKRGPGIDDEPFELTIQRRAQQLIIEPGDFVEVRALVSTADDLFDENRDYRTTPNRFMLCAPDGGFVHIRLLDKTQIA